MAGEQPGTALVLDLPTEAVRCTLAPHPGLNRAVLSPDGRWAATSGWHTTSVKVWDARTGSMVKELPLGVNNTAFFSPDGRTLVTSRGDEYRSWDVGSWLPARRLPWEIQSYPGWVAFSPDRKLLALELSPAVIHLVDAATGRTVAKLEDPRSDRAQWLGFTPDGARLVTIATFSRADPCLGPGGDPPASRRDASRLGFAAVPAELRRGSPTASWSSPARRAVSLEHAADDRARREIEAFRLALESHPTVRSTCNNLAWAYATAPEHLRDPSQAVALAEKAARTQSG